MNSKFLLKTDRTVIEKISALDAPFFLELVNTSGWLRFIGDRNVHSIEQAEQFLEDGLLRSYTDNEFGYYLIREKVITSDESSKKDREGFHGEPMGICGFLKKPHLEHEDFGFALLPQFQGNGIAYEAGKAMLSFGVEQFRFQVLDAVTHPDNDRSQALLKKLGFQFIQQIHYDGQDGLSNLFRLNLEASLPS